MPIPAKLAAAAALALAALAPAASAADVKMIAQVSAVKLAADGKWAVVTVKNTKGGAEVAVKVTDQPTLDKLAAKSIAPGDQVRLSYDDSGGANLAKTLKKAEGC